MNRFALSLFAIFLCLTSVNAFAGKYLSDSQVQKLIAFLPEPPSKESKDPASVQTYENDFKKLLEIQNTVKAVRDVQCLAVQAEAELNMPLPFIVPLGPMSPAEYSKWTAFSQTLYLDVKPITKGIKARFSRPRPYVNNDHDGGPILPCVDYSQESAGSYPSAHATMGELYARIFAKVYASRGKAFLTRGKQYGFDRLIAGVHHPSDVKAGQDLADQIYAELISNPDFVTDLGKIDSETGF